MPHDPEAVITFAMEEYARQYDEIRDLKQNLAVEQQFTAALQRQNTELKVLLIDAVRQMKDVETTLLRALDKDR